MKGKIKNLLIILVLIIFIMSLPKKTFQNDTFFSIACGNNYIQNGLTQIDTLTWHDNLSFTNVRWLYDIIIAMLYNTFGFKGIYIFVIIISELIGLLFFRFLVNQNINKYFALLSTMAMMYLGGKFLTARAQIISILIFIIEMYSIEKLIESGKLKYGIVLIILPIILANVHASIFPIYFIFFIPTIAEIIISKFLKQNETEKFEIRKFKYSKIFIIIFIISMFTGLVTPIKKFAPYTSMYREATGISSEMILELLPINVKTSTDFFLINFIFILSLIYNKRKINLSDIFLIIGLDILALVTYRAKIYLIFVGSIVIIKMINNILEDYKFYDLFFNKKINNVLYILFVLIMVSTSLRNFSAKMLGEYVDSINYPIDECNYILNNIELENMRIYNGFNYGSYLEFKGIKSFIDSRSGLFSKEFNDTNILEDYYNVSVGLENYKKLFEKYDITHALVPYESIEDNYLKDDENWKIIYSGNCFELFEKIN